MAGPIRTGDSVDLVVDGKASTSSKVPRPPNAWIVFRSEKLREIEAATPTDGPKLGQGAISTIISGMWRNISDQTRLEYERLAEEKKAEHAIKYPGYRFTPLRKEERAKLRLEQKALKEAAKKKRQLERGKSKGQKKTHQPTPPPAQASASTSATTTAPNTPAMVPIPAAQLFPYLDMSAYYPMASFGTGGPSPPLSSASSPAPSTSPATTASPEEVPGTTRPSSAPIDALPYPFPQHVLPFNPYLPILGPGAPYSQSTLMPPIAPQTTQPAVPEIHSQQPIVQAPQVIIDPPYELMGGGQPNNLPPLLHELDASFYLQSADRSGFNPNVVHPTAQENLSFDLNPELFGMIHENPGFSLDAFDTSANLDAFSLSNDVFSLENFDLNTDLNGEITVTFGEYAQPQPGYDFGQIDSEGMMNAVNQMSSFLQQVDPELASMANLPKDWWLPQEQTTVPDFQQVTQMPTPSPSTTSQPSFPPTPLQSALSLDLSNTDGSQSSSASTSYAPPSGAAMSSTRRVGGRWKPPTFVHNDGLSDYGSPLVSA